MTFAFPNIPVTNEYNSPGLQCKISVCSVLSRNLFATILVTGVFQVGETLTFRYVLVNNFGFDINAVTFEDLDPVETPPAPLTLADGEAVTFEVSYIVTAADISAGSIVRKAGGSGTDSQFANPVTATLFTLAVTSPVQPMCISESLLTSRSPVTPPRRIRRCR